MFKLDSVPGVEVEVEIVKHLPKCARCFKHSETVDKDPVFPMTCPRCSTQMHTLFYDVNFGHTQLLPSKLTTDVDEFIQTYVREELRNYDWKMIQEKFAQVSAEEC